MSCDRSYFRHSGIFFLHSSLGFSTQLRRNIFYSFTNVWRKPYSTYLQQILYNFCEFWYGHYTYTFLQHTHGTIDDKIHLSIIYKPNIECHKMLEIFWITIGFLGEISLLQWQHFFYYFKNYVVRRNGELKVEQIHLLWIWFSWKKN